MNNIELEKKVKQITHALAYENGYVCSVDVLLKLGYLSKNDHESWRFGRISHLEKVCNTNLNKLTTINKLIRKYAHELKLEKSLIIYNKYGKGGKTRLIFSKSGDKNIEEAYAIHFINKIRLKEIQMNKAAPVVQKPGERKENTITPANDL